MINQENLIRIRRAGGNRQIGRLLIEVGRVGIPHSSGGSREGGGAPYFV